MLGSTTKQKQVTEIQCTRSLTIIRNIQKGETIETKDIIACRPSGGIPPDLKTVFVGRKAARKIEKDELATLDMI
jgi:sialic acid synthase SpsE